MELHSSLLRLLCLVIGAAPLAAAAEALTEKPLILVTGATGKQGGAVVDHLLERGFRLRGLTRTPEDVDARALAARGVEIVQGDFIHPPSVERAASGVHGMFFNSPSTVPDEASVGVAVIDAARRAGVRHIVYTSYFHANPDKGLPQAPKFKVEDHLRRSGVTYTILRPGTFMDNVLPSRQKVLAEGLRDARPPDFKQQFIATHDIGFFAAEAFTHPEQWQDRALEIASDELTGPAQAELLAAMLGQPVPYRHITWEETGIPARYLDTLRWSTTGAVRADIGALRKRYPQLLTYQEFLERNWGKK